MTTNEMHLIFGTGPAGTTLAEVLHAQGKQVRCINRSGKAAVTPGISVVAGDVLDVEQVRSLCAGATVVYHCANAPYPQQVELIPRFQTNIIDGAARAKAKLIVLDTLYVYGETQGEPMTEATPYAATTRKGRMRAQVAQTYLAAHQAGTVQVALGRSADFFGPRVLNSALGDRVFPSVFAKKSVQLLGNLDLPHSYTYIEDVARGLATLGARPEALGCAWLLPVVAPPVTQRQMVQLIGEQIGHPVRIQALPKLAIQAIGLFDANMREFVEMFYQYTEPQIVISHEFEQTFRWSATPLDVALRATLDWYRQHQPSAKSVQGKQTHISFLWL
ncbi:MAG: NAD-dependent epimerase/dehydratase family protein [Aulosira sp. DedQUE10]|nr:NAD-dependent epimerase/dehydratase family protein [Aulosira sp. DedQUE10]